MDASSPQRMDQFDIMACLDEYNASVSSESFSSCTTDDIFIKNGGLVSEAHPHHFGNFDHHHHHLDHDERPTKLMRTSSCSWGSSSNNNDNLGSPSSSCNLLSFSTPSNASDQATTQHYSKGNLMLKPKLEVDYEPLSSNTHDISIQKSYSGIDPPAPSNSLSHEHVIAERKRRQKLSQKFIALSALVPGLKKMDKASVLEEAAKYLKNLQERVTTLEEKLNYQRNVKSVVLNKTYLSIDDNDNDEDVSSSEEGAVLLPDIQVKTSGNDVLLIIHCEKQPGLIGKILNVMENLHLCVTSSNSMPFGNYEMIITLTAQIKSEISIKPREVVRKLRTVL